MKARLLQTALVLLLFICPPATADVINLQPNPADLYDLSHSWYYTWGLGTDKDSLGIEITSAVLRFDNIRNWNRSDNQLYIHLLETAEDGVRRHYDCGGWADAFAGQGVELVTYYNLPDTAQDLEYVFTPSQLASLNDYLHNGDDFGLGFDPDCHFYNDGVCLSLEWSQVPEPATLAILMTALPLFLRRRRTSRYTQRKT